MDRNPSPPRLSAEEIELIEGDKIGETVFSKKWALTTLMKLVQSIQSDKTTRDRNEEEAADQDNIEELLDQELCELWDMSMNSDVAAFLQEVDAIDVLLDAILGSHTPRITEISVGILGNMACNRDVCIQMMKNTKFIEIMTALLQDADAPVLVETTRLINVCISTEEMLPQWLAQLEKSAAFESLMFILENSLNTDLLSNCAHLVDKLLDCSDELLQTYADETLVGAVSEAMKQMRSQQLKLVEALLHILQLISTVEEGVQALVSCSSVVSLLCHFIAECGHDEGGIIVGRELSLTASFSVLNVILLAEPLTVLRAMGRDHRIMKILMGILGYSCKIHRKRSKSRLSVSETEESKESQSVVQTKTQAVSSEIAGSKDLSTGGDDTPQTMPTKNDVQGQQEIKRKGVSFEGSDNDQGSSSGVNHNSANASEKTPGACTEHSEADVHHRYFTVAIGVLRDIISESAKDPQCVSGMLAPHEKILEKIVHYASRVSMYRESICELVESTLSIPELSSLHHKLSRMLFSRQDSEKDQ